MENKTIIKVAIGALVAVALGVLLLFGPMPWNSHKQDTQGQQANVASVQTGGNENSNASNDNTSSLQSIQQTNNGSSSENAGSPEQQNGGGQEAVSGSGEAEGNIRSYEPGEKAEYEQWFALAAPKGFYYDNESGMFVNDDTIDLFSFYTGHYEDADAQDLNGIVEQEREHAHEYVDGESHTDVRDIEAGNRTWKAVVLTTKADDGSDVISLVQAFADLGQGCYAACVLYADPSEKWVIDMLSSFEPLMGNPADNWERYRASLEGNLGAQEGEWEEAQEG